MASNQSSVYNPTNEELIPYIERIFEEAKKKVGTGFKITVEEALQYPAFVAKATKMFREERKVALEAREAEERRKHNGMVDEIVSLARNMESNLREEMSDLPPLSEELPKPSSEDRELLAKELISIAGFKLNPGDIRRLDAQSMFSRLAEMKAEHNARIRKRDLRILLQTAEELCPKPEEPENIPTPQWLRVIPDVSEQKKADSQARLERAMVENRDLLPWLTPELLSGARGYLIKVRKSLDVKKKKADGEEAETIGKQIDLLQKEINRLSSLYAWIWDGDPGNKKNWCPPETYRSHEEEFEKHFRYVTEVPKITPQLSEEEIAKRQNLLRNLVASLRTVPYFRMEDHETLIARAKTALKAGGETAKQMLENRGKRKLLEGDYDAAEAYLRAAGLSENTIVEMVNAAKRSAPEQK